MFIAIDDTDSREGMCTTYALSEIIARSGLDVIGFPSLVRLNPAIPYKTRGNGALSVNLAKGRGTPFRVGKLGTEDLLGYPGIEDEPEREDLLAIGREVAVDLSVSDEPDTNPGVVVSEGHFPEQFYWKAVRRILTIPEAEDFIVRNGGSYWNAGNGRGIIGAAAAISWPGRNFTFELLSYRYPSAPSYGHGAKFRVAELCETIPWTFNNIDRENNYPAVFPKERTPVVMGIRGNSGAALIDSFPAVLGESGIRPDRYLLYRTNQGTDDHIIEESGKLDDSCSYRLRGEVTVFPYTIQGSHYFSRINSNGQETAIAAFEPTKEFRRIFRQLRPGDFIEVFGTFKDGCINVEKMEVLSVSTEYVRENPLCTNCGSRMHSKGHGDYRCGRCRTRRNLPSYRKAERSLRTGRYDVPVIARRHLSRPFELDSMHPVTIQGGIQ